MLILKMMTMMMIMIIFLIMEFTPLAFAEKSVPILVYHSVSEYDGLMEKELYVTPDHFQQQMNYLKNNGFTLLTFDRWDEVERFEKPIFITFDDGYKNNLNAYHIFQQLKAPDFKPTGTIFVISDFIGRPYRLTTGDLKMLVKSDMFSIQSHTATHPDLTKATNYQYELGESKNKISQVTGKPVIALAYPYGIYNDQVIMGTKKFYQYGLTTNPGPYRKTGVKDELYLLPRIYVKYSTTVKDFIRIVNGNF